METAARELQEEIGMRPGVVEPFGGLYVAAGYTSEYIHLFICRELVPATDLHGDEDEDIEVEILSLDECLEAIDEGRICDAKSLVALLRYARRSLP
jgi:ADP-ribose pyrophosphatase